MLTSLLAAASLACATSSPSAAPRQIGDRGEQLYRGHCGACHRLRDPSEQTRDRWAWAVERYGPRAHLSETERKLVLAYLQSHAKDAHSGPGDAR